jgi:hypothetical protein
MRPILILMISAFTSIAFAADEGFSSLEEQMTGKEFSATGLHKLTAEELNALNQWIRKNSLGTLATPTADVDATTPATDEKDRRGLPSDSGDDERPIVSRLIGKFDGWDGQTVFKLENGMIWVQADKDKFYVREIENPEVTIKPGLFSAWYLRIEGYHSKCKVRRIQ